MKQPLYKAIASALDEYRRSVNDTRFNSMYSWDNKLKEYEKQFLPSGSGFDSGSVISMESQPNKIIIETSFHHMNDAGMYDGWTEHTVKVIPSLQFDFELKISGRNRNDIKDYIYDVFDQSLRQEIEI